MDGYGIIHQDAHLESLFIDENYQITLFDFDDCVYVHFKYDIAMVLSYIVYGKDNALEFTKHFWMFSLKGMMNSTILIPNGLRKFHTS